jgi:hypothetical protein
VSSQSGLAYFSHSRTDEDAPIFPTCARDSGRLDLLQIRGRRHNQSLAIQLNHNCLVLLAAIIQPSSYTCLCVGRIDAILCRKYHMSGPAPISVNIKRTSWYMHFRATDAVYPRPDTASPRDAGSETFRQACRHSDISFRRHFMSYRPTFLTGRYLFKESVFQASI